jgi:RimJ/RimL family protein N-acetyltransferase
MGDFDWGNRLPRLRGDRVELRALEDGDVPALFGIFGDPEVMRYWSTPPFASVKEALDLLAGIRAGFHDRRFFQWGVQEIATGELVGTCTLFYLIPAHRRAEIGYALARPRWGSGLGSDAVRTLVGFAFDTLGLHRLEADVDPRNARSLRLLERQGFRREGLLRDRYQVSGEIQDAVLLGLLRPEWIRR